MLIAAACETWPTWISASITCPVAYCAALSARAMANGRCICAELVFERPCRVKEAPRRHHGCLGHRTGHAGEVGADATVRQVRLALPGGV